MMTANRGAMSEPIPKLTTLLWRGCRKRCPQCGQGALYQRWMKLHDRCSVCGLQYLPNQGDLWGPLVFVDRVVFLIPLVVIFYFLRWQPNLIILALFGGAMLFLLVYTVPHRNGMSVALDYLIRRKSGELVGPNSSQ
jgi:uncharacterized protein (DUF983 family)